MPFVASKLLEAIDRELTIDGGERFSNLFHKLYLESPPGWFESSGKCIGASGLGKECARSVWYDFRWASPRRRDPRSLRIFQRGNVEEIRFRALLVLAGVRVWLPDELGKKGKFYSEHTAGVTDGGVKGVPDLPDAGMLSEFKTHNEDSFDKITKIASNGEVVGLQKGKPDHYVQVQLYMHHTGAKKCLYFAVCKNDDRLYAEIIDYDPYFTEKLVEKGRAIVFGDAPDRISNNPTFYVCKYLCDHADVCHKPDVQPLRSCRTCRHSVVGKFSWSCRLHNITKLSDEKQRSGCENYVMRSDFVKVRGE